MKHKHAELIKAWADGAKIQYFSGLGYWNDIDYPGWLPTEEYRIKPDPRPQWQQDLIDAAKAGKVVEFDRRRRGDWVEFGSCAHTDDWVFNESVKEQFRIRPEKVTRYLWVYKGTVLNHFASETEVRLNGFQDEYKRLDWSATDFEE